MISVQDLSYGYPGRGIFLRNISFTLEPGRMLGLAGPNGSGKTTLLAMLAGLFTPSGGVIRVGSIESPGQEDGLRRAGGMVMQDADLQILGATVKEDFDLGFEDAAPAEAETGQILAGRLGLPPLWDAAVHTLSYGQKRRLCLASALRKKPDFLLLDEPFAGLDYPGIVEMRGLLLENKTIGLTQIVAAHDLEPLADLVDDWLVLREGEGVLTGKAASVFPRLAEFGVRPPCSWQAGLGIKAWDWGAHGG